MSVMSKLKATLADPFKFIPLLKIKNKAGKMVPLKLNSEQIAIIEAFESGNEDLVILKSRQIGSSTVVSAYLFWKWYVSSSPITIAILSHKLASSKHILNMWFRFWDNLPLPLQRPLLVRNTIEMKLKDTEAEVIAVSAEGKGGLRSFTANYIHLSEYAFSPDPEELKATAVASLNEGRLIQESTANRYGDAHHLDILKAQRGEAGLKLLFFPWSFHEEYTASHPMDNDPKSFCTDEGGQLTDLTDEEADLDLSTGQILWRRMKIQQLGKDKFKREYPLTIEDAYGSTSNAYFSEEDLRHCNVLSTPCEDDEILTIHPYSANTSYGIGVDVAAGVGEDNSTIVVLDKATWQIAAMWQSNRCSISELVDRIEWLSATYGGAKCLVEGNSIGIAALTELRSRGFKNLWLDEDSKDWNTNSKTKWLMFEALREAVRTGCIRDLPMIISQELRAFFINDKGNIDYPPHHATHGDSVIALALALQCIKQVSLPTKSHLPDWVRDVKLSKAQKKLSYQSTRRY